MAAASSKMTLKLLIDKKANKVLFAEAGKEVVDFLCSILTLPVGTVIRLLSGEGMVGCLPKLYQSIENLDLDYIQLGQQKDTVLRPTVHNSTEQAPLFLLPSATSNKKSETKELYMCSLTNAYARHYYATNLAGTSCPNCGSGMNNRITIVEGKKVAAAAVVAGGGGGEGGFVKGVITYMVMDDLVVTPMSTITGITLLNKFSVKDVGALEEMVVNLDKAKGLKLLKTCFKSKYVLTEVFLWDLNI